MICDFCGAPDPPNEYPCKDFEFPMNAGESVGSWMACDICAELIETRDRRPLQTRAVAGYILRYRDVSTYLTQQQVAQFVWEAHTKFFENREVNDAIT